MKIFLVVSFIMANTAALDRPLFVFKNPNFETIEQCKQYVSVMHQRIYATASASYNFEHAPEAIYCLTIDQVKNIFKYNYEEKEKKNI